MKKKNITIIVILAALAVIFAILTSYNRRKEKSEAGASAYGPGSSGSSNNKNQYIGIANEARAEQIEAGTADGPLKHYPPKTYESDASKPSVYPLKRGSRGEAVEFLQLGLNQVYFNVLNENRLAKLDDDGIFGAKTEEMLYELYGTRIVDKSLAVQIAEDTGIHGYVGLIENIN